jgi:hypothetical protein
MLLQLLLLLRLLLGLRLLHVASKHSPAVLLPDLLLFGPRCKALPLVWLLLLLRLLLVQLFRQLMIQLVIDAVPTAAEWHERHHGRRSIRWIVTTCCAAALCCASFRAAARHWRTLPCCSDVFLRHGRHPCGVAVSILVGDAHAVLSQS